MRVGVDGTSWENRRGFGRFARNAVGRLIELDPETEYVLFGKDATAPAAHGTRPLREVVRLGLASRGFDAFLFPSHYSYFPVLGRRVIVGIHDTTALDLPEETLPGRRDRFAWRAKEWLALRQATRVFTVSEAARTALRERYAVEATVVPEAPDEVFHPREATGGEPYLLYAGGLSPHKDVVTLLEAYARLGDAPPLVLVGGDDPYLSSRAGVEERIRRLGLGARVSITGYVEDEELAQLYSGAVAFVSPSLAEGFGLTPVEAAACGAPTILSDIAAHRETLGDAALFFPPRDVEALRTQLESVLSDADLRATLAARGRERVSRFSWDASAEALRDLIHEVAT